MNDTGDYVRRYYGVPAQLGGRVVAVGCPGRITGFAGQYVWIELDDCDTAAPYHPTWCIDYLDASGSVVFASTGDDVPVVAGVSREATP